MYGPNVSVQLIYLLLTKQYEDGIKLLSERTGDVSIFFSWNALPDFDHSIGKQKKWQLWQKL